MRWKSNKKRKSKLSRVLARRRVASSAAPHLSASPRDGVRSARLLTGAALSLPAVAPTPAIARPILLRVLAPQLVDELARHQVAAIHSYEPEHEAAVLLQVPKHKVLANELSQMRLLLHELYSVLDVLVSNVGEEASHYPSDEIVDVDERHERQPKPNEHEDLLVEQVDREHTLHSVRVHLGHVAHFKVAHGHARKVDRVGRVPALHDVLHDLDAVQVKVLVAEQNVQQEELAQRVGQVEELDEKVKAN